MSSRIIVCDEKHDRRYLPAETDDQLHGSALKLLKERLEDGWYDNWDDGDPRNEWETRAQAIADSEDGHAAWRFLQERADHEYERVHLGTVG